MAEIAEIVKDITDDVRTIVKGEIELAKAELVPSAKAAGRGAGMFGGAGYLALNALRLLFLAGAGGLGLLFALAGLAIVPALVLGLVAMAVLLLILAATLAAVGRASLARAKGPQQAVANANGTVADVKQALVRGQRDVDTMLAGRKTKARTAAVPVDVVEVVEVVEVPDTVQPAAQRPTDGPATA